MGPSRAKWTVAISHDVWRNDVTCARGYFKFEGCLSAASPLSHQRSTALVLTKHARQVRLSSSWIVLIQVTGEVIG